MSAAATESALRKSRRKRSPYVTIACVYVEYHPSSCLRDESCKRRKTKCSGERPCQGCRDSETPCVYDRSTRFHSTDGGAAKPNESPASPLVTRRQHAPRRSGPKPDRKTRSNAEPEGPSNYGSSDYYLRLAEKRLVALSPESCDKSPLETQRPVVRAQAMQHLINHRKSGSPRSNLTLIEVDQWKSIFHRYEEEVGLQYPFIDCDDLRWKIRLAHSGADDAQVSKDLDGVDDMAALVLAVVSRFVEPDAAEAANALVEELYATALVRAQLHSIDKIGMTMIILCSIFFFLGDKEILAWRAIGIVMRVLQEKICCSAEEIPATTSLDQLRDVGEKFFWTVYTLDHRWSFGTGLSFAVPDSEIRRRPMFTDDSLSAAYLKYMVEYCGISAEIRNSLLQPSGTMPPATASITSTRNFLDFQVVQWQRNLPQKLQFRGVDDKFDPATEHRGEYRIRLMLYLRCNQMRTIIHRKSALSFEAGTFDSSTSNIMAEVAQDTIRVLISLARETDIYHAQHKTFNHFLETALTSLLLTMCHVGGEHSVSYLPDVLAAMELVRSLSTHSTITRALERKLRGVQHIVRNLRFTAQEQAQGNSQLSAGGREPANGVRSVSSSRGQQFQPRGSGPNNVERNAASLNQQFASAQPSTSEQPLESGIIGEATISKPPYSQASRELRPNTVQQNMYLGDGTQQPHNDRTLSLSDQSSQYTDDLSFPADMDLTGLMDLLPNDFFALQFPELGETLRDYENFMF